MSIKNLLSIALTGAVFSLQCSQQPSSQQSTTVSSTNAQQNDTNSQPCTLSTITKAATQKVPYIGGYLLKKDDSWAPIYVRPTSPFASDKAEVSKQK